MATQDDGLLEEDRYMMANEAMRERERDRAERDMPELLAAALAYGAAWEAYVAAYDAWRDAHPGYEADRDHDQTPSWQADVKPACHEASVAGERLRNVARNLYATEKRR